MLQTLVILNKLTCIPTDELDPRLHGNDGNFCYFHPHHLRHHRHSRASGNPAVFPASARLNQLISTFIDELDPRLHGDDSVFVIFILIITVISIIVTTITIVILAHDCMDAGAFTEAGIQPRLKLLPKQLIQKKHMNESHQLAINFHENRAQLCVNVRKFHP